MQATNGNPVANVTPLGVTRENGKSVRLLLAEQLRVLRERQQARREYVAQIQQLIDKRELEIDNLQAQLDQEDAAAR